MARQRYSFLGFHLRGVYTLGLVLPGTAFNDHPLLHLWACRDQPFSFRSARGRIRTRCWLPHRVQWDALGGILPGGIWQYDHCLGNCHCTIPWWVGRSWGRVFSRSWYGFWLAIPWQYLGHWLLHYQGLLAVFRLHLGTYYFTAPACRPVNAVCLVDPDSCHPRKYPAYSPDLSHRDQLRIVEPGLSDRSSCSKLPHARWLHLGY